MNRFRLLTLPMAGVLLGLCVSTGAAAQNAQAEVLPLPINEVRMFTEALDRIRRAYVEEIDDKTLLENAIKGMLSGLDPHSALSLIHISEPTRPY